MANRQPLSAERPINRVWIWALLSIAALLWPSRLSGPFDGVPLDGPAEAIVLGVAAPALLWFHSRFLRTRVARVAIVALLAWKAVTAAVLVQDGWCVRFMPSRPFVMDATGAPHSWDVRADWRADDPACSAIATRPYRDLEDFPVWFFNLPPPSESWPGPLDRPPGASTGMTVSGFIHSRQPADLQLITGRDGAAQLQVDANTSRNAKQGRMALAPGTHQVLVDATLTGDRWGFAPLWNGADLWSETAGRALWNSPTATVRRPSRLDLVVRPWGEYVAAVFVIVLMLPWTVSAIARVSDADVLSWTLGASACIGLLVALGHDQVARWSVAALAGAALLRVPSRLRNLFGAFVLVGIPWLTFIVVLNAAQIGRFHMYEVGHDHWMYQRWAYRIVMQGFWLEGGSPTFMAQPFHRWTVGVLHVIFGDSSIGECFWDAASVVAMALVAFHIAKRFAGFRWGLVAAVTTLTVYTVGTTWRHLGTGLCEMSSAGFAYLAVLLTVRARGTRWSTAVAAGVLATLAFYTRLNNLPVSIGVASFALPLTVPARSAFRPSAWWSRRVWTTATVVLATLAAALLFFAWRTWHYTGVFSIFYGTSLRMHSVAQPGMSIGDYLRAMFTSVMMVMTMNVPPRFDARALPVLAGFLFSVCAIAGVPHLRDLPLAAVLFCLAGIAGFLVASDTAYDGRFSVHVLGATSAVTTCTVALLWKAVARARSRVNGRIDIGSPH